MKKKKSTKVIEARLGKYRVNGKYVYGFALINKNKILIDPRQNARCYLDTLIHEKLHLLFPTWSESRIGKTARELSLLLWEHAYRRVDA